MTVQQFQQRLRNCFPQQNLSVLDTAYKFHETTSLSTALPQRSVKLNTCPGKKALTFGEQHFFTTCSCCRSQNSPQVSWIPDVVADEN